MRKKLAVAKLETIEATKASTEHRRVMLKFIRIAMALFKRAPHSEHCPAREHLTAECKCGLDEIQQELTTVTASVVLDSMSK